MGLALRIGIVAGFVVALAGLVSAIAGAELWVWILLILAGAAIAVVSGGLMMAHDLYRSLRGWRELFRDGGPDELRLVGAEPPKGFLFRRDATLKFEARRGDGPSKQVEHGIPVPIPQAFLWRVLGRVPTPIGRLTDERKLNLAIRRSRKRKGADAATDQAPGEPSA